LLVFIIFAGVWNSRKRDLWILKRYGSLWPVLNYTRCSGYKEYSAFNPGFFPTPEIVSAICNIRLLTGCSCGRELWPSWGRHSIRVWILQITISSCGYLLIHYLNSTWRILYFQLSATVYLIGRLTPSLVWQSLWNTNYCCDNYDCLETLTLWSVNVTWYISGFEEKYIAGAALCLL